MMKKLFLLCFALFFVSALMAGNNTKKSEKESEKISTLSFSGIVSDEKTGESLVGVEVRIEGTNRKAYTDFDGKFKFPDLKPGNYNLVASYISYNKTSVTDLKMDENGTVNIKMQTAK